MGCVTTFVTFTQAGGGKAIVNPEHIVAVGVDRDHGSGDLVTIIMLAGGLRYIPVRESVEEVAAIIGIGDSNPGPKMTA